MVIGLTGACCAGKNQVAALLEARGIPALDLDKVGHEVLETEKAALTARFGEDILGPGGRVDRKRLGEKVFGEARRGELAALEAIVHPAVDRAAARWVAERGGRACVVHAALLHRAAIFSALDALIVVEAPFLTRLLRARRRDRLPWGVILRRWGSQRSFTAQYFSRGVDTYRVRNGGFFALPGAGASGAGPGGPPRGGTLERQIDEILSQVGVN